MESHVLSRIFEFNGVRLPDPDPKLSPEEVRNLYSLIRLVLISLQDRAVKRQTYAASPDR
jgi:PRTRC genetic system protein C